ncbi:MAG TPA: carboxypeptidase-like regulatory domain-containing protein [Terriglobia bacterium]|jgi:hypothetical protein|nr:carboxypeptidase-like regulatory domain-containing protein [Terriglobia bacterium]
MRTVATPFIGLLICVFYSVAGFAQAQIQGRVINGTSQQPVPGQVVQLLLPRGGMQVVATATTDAEGRFAIDQAEIDPNTFYLAQAVYNDVSYHAPVQFDSSGVANVGITVYESGAADSALRIKSARILVHAEGRKIRVQEMYALENASSPARVYTNSAGTFRFWLAAGAGEPSVTATGLMNMPLPQIVTPGKVTGEYSIQYPLKPGITGLMVSYEADYSAAKFVLADRIPYPIRHMELFVSPPTLTVDSSIFKSVGQDAETGSAKLEASNLEPGTAFEASLAGEAVASPSPAPAQGEDEIKTLPNPMTRLGVPLCVAFLLFLFWALAVRLGKELPRLKEQRGTSPQQKKLEAKVEELFNSIADLDQLFAEGKVIEGRYWRERLELKAQLIATLKKGPPSLRESYVSRHTPR